MQHPCAGEGNGKVELAWCFAPMSPHSPNRYHNSLVELVAPVVEPVETLNAEGGLFSIGEQPTFFGASEARQLCSDLSLRAAANNYHRGCACSQCPSTNQGPEDQAGVCTGACEARTGVGQRSATGGRARVCQ